MQRGKLGAGESWADLAAFVSMAPVGEQFAHELYTYKNPAVGERDRQRMTVGLGAVLWGDRLAAHERCVAGHVYGVEQLDVITTIPSTSSQAGSPARTRRRRNSGRQRQRGTLTC